MKLSFAIAALLFASVALQAGTPLTCFPFEIGDAKSLPWLGTAGHWNAIDPSYDTARLPDDVVAVLTPNAPVLVHMETLRRATSYAMKDRQAGARLLATLNERASRTNDAMALFDAGYIREAYRQVQLPSDSGGIALIEKAAQLHGPDPEMDFALAYAYAGSRSPNPMQRTYADRARAAAKPGSILARNLQSHQQLLPQPTPNAGGLPHSL